MTGRRVIRGGTLLALDGRPEVRRTDLLIEGGRIAAIGGVQDPRAEVQTVRGLVMPGLVQAHVHLDLTLQDARYVPALDPNAQLDGQRQAWTDALDPEGARTSAQAGLAWGLAAGATTVVDVSSARRGLAALQAARAVGSRLVLCVDGGRPEAREAGRSVRSLS